MFIIPSISDLFDNSIDDAISELVCVEIFIGFSFVYEHCKKISDSTHKKQKKIRPSSSSIYNHLPTQQKMGSEKHVLSKNGVQYKNQTLFHVMPKIQHVFFIFSGAF